MRRATAGFGFLAAIAVLYVFVPLVQFQTATNVRGIRAYALCGLAGTRCSKDPVFPATESGLGSMSYYFFRFGASVDRTYQVTTFVNGAPYTTTLNDSAYALDFG